MAKVNPLKTYQALTDDAFKDTSFKLRQSKAGEILSEAHKHLSLENFKKLQDYVFMRLEK